MSPSKTNQPGYITVLTRKGCSLCGTSTIRAHQDCGAFVCSKCQTTATHVCGAISTVIPVTPKARVPRTPRVKAEPFICQCWDCQSRRSRGEEQIKGHDKPIIKALPQETEILRGWRGWRVGRVPLASNLETKEPQFGHRLFSVSQSGHVWHSGDEHAVCGDTKSAREYQLTTRDRCAAHLSRLKPGRTRSGQSAGRNNPMRRRRRAVVSTHGCGLYALHTLTEYPANYGQPSGVYAESDPMMGDVLVLGVVLPYGTVATTEKGYLSSDCMIEALFIVPKRRANSGYTSAQMMRPGCGTDDDITAEMEARMQMLAAELSDAYGVPVRITTQGELLAQQASGTVIGTGD